MTLPAITTQDQARTLSDVIEGLGFADNPQLSVAELVEAFGERAFGALILILALMALFPWPPGGKAVFSAPIILLSLELAVQRDTVWLPRWVLKASVSRAVYRSASQKVIKPIRWVERLTRPRLPMLTGEIADVIVGVVCALLAVMLALPVPLGDMLPALTLVIFGLALTQRDGLAIVVGAIGTVICGVYLVLVWAAVVAIGEKIIGWLTGLF
jgi:hypothetical protein